MKVIVGADSLALPRPYDVRSWKPGDELGVRVEDTYSFLLERALRAALPDQDVLVMNRGTRHQTLSGLAADVLDLVHNMEPDVLVLQAGIVDCWPRADLGGEARVPLEDFAAALDVVRGQLALRPTARLVVIGICPTSRQLDERFPGTLSRITRYDAVLREACRVGGHAFVDMAAHVDPDDPQRYLMADDNHLNRDGHLLVAQQLLGAILRETPSVADPTPVA